MTRPVFDTTKCIIEHVDPISPLVYDPTVPDAPPTIIDCAPTLPPILPPVIPASDIPCPVLLVSQSSISIDATASRPTIDFRIDSIEDCEFDFFLSITIPTIPPPPVICP